MLFNTVECNYSCPFENLRELGKFDTLPCPLRSRLAPFSLTTAFLLASVSLPPRHQYVHCSPRGQSIKAPDSDSQLNECKEAVLLSCILAFGYCRRNLPSLSRIRAETRALSSSNRSRTWEVNKRERINRG